MSNEQKKEIQFRWPADSIPGPACYVNKSLHYEFMNKQYRIMFNIEPSIDILKLHVKDVLKEKFDEAQNHIKKVFNGETILYELNLGFATIQVHYIPDYLEYEDKQSEIIGFFMMGIDVTELRATQHNYKEELEKEIRIKTRDLSNTLEDLKSTQKLLIEHEKMAALGTLVLGIAHELNTPLGITLTGVSYLNETTENITKKYKDDKLDENDFTKFLSSSTEITDNILINIAKINNLVDKFKQLSTPNKSNSYKSFNLYEYTNILILDLKNKYKKLNIKNNIPINTNIKISQDAYKKVIEGLIVNSIDHAFEDIEKGHITLDFKEDKNQYILDYSDNGKGIKKENLNSIFNPFFTTRRDRNPGLGLNIIYNIIVTQLNGNITCSSEENKGTNFKITINN